MKPNMTFKEKTKNSIDYSKFTVLPKPHIVESLKKQKVSGVQSMLHPVKTKEATDNFLVIPKNLNPALDRSDQRQKELVVAPQKSKEHLRFVDNKNTFVTLNTQAQATNIEESGQFEVESEGQTRAKQDEIFN
jgi:hypothetical protein